MSRVPSAPKSGGPSLRGAIFCAIFNALLGVLLGVVALAATPAKDYKPTPDSKTGKIPPVPTAGIWYWAGGGSGDWKSKDALFLAEKPAEVVISEGELNSWAQANMKGAAPIVKSAKAKPAPKPAAPATPAAGQKKDAPAIPSGPTFEMVQGTPNFHIFHDPLAPEPGALAFQMAMPFNVTVLGGAETVVLQVRGVFVSGVDGPKLQAYYCAFGSARLPTVFAQTLINAASSAMAGSEDGKAYTTAWAKYGGATLREGELVLTGK